MNERKICFITCVNDQELYKESLIYIKNLILPEGYQVESINIEEAPCLTKAYNQAMKSSDAKYKVYLHQDVFIINKNFIRDIVNIFTKNKKVGMLGVAGAKKIPANGVWWESINKYGKVYDSHSGKMELLQFNEVEGDYESVQAIDGLIMITQYDLPWREDVFDGWHFYDISQSVEFIKAGYEVGIPTQHEPWCIHDCGIVNVKNGYEKYRDIFLDEYSKYLFPLVSILIPAYNRPDYFKIALESAINQTYRNIEIVICDDSTNNKVENIVKKYFNQYSFLRYYKNKKQLGKETGLENAQKCFELSKGEYINFLMDDDIFHPQKISKMMSYFLEDKNIKLVTSYRQVIDKDGNNLNPIKATQKIFDSNSIIDGRALGRYIIENNLNVIGEGTTVLFKKSDLESNFGVYLGRQYKPLSDISTWLLLLSKGNAVYISEALSYFRLHDNQNANDIRNMIQGCIEWFYLIHDSNKTYFIDNNTDYHKQLNTWLNNNMSIIELINNKKMNRDFKEKNYELLEELYKCFKACFGILLLQNEFRRDTYIKEPLVSIIIPAYNHEHYILNTLDSIVNQTYNNIELIIINDGSEDNTHSKILSYKDILNERFSRFEYINKKNEGVCKTLNKGLRLAKGDYIIPFASDDYMFPERIRLQVEYLENNKEYGMVYTDGFNYTSNEDLGPQCSYKIQDLFSKHMEFREGDIFEFLLTNVYQMPSPTVCIRRKCFEEIGYYDEKLIYEDPDMFLRISKNFQIGYIKKILTIHRIHNTNAGKNPGILIAGGILMEEKWRNMHFNNPKNKNKLLNYLYKIKALDYKKGKDFFDKGYFEKANIHFEIAMQGANKLVQFISDINVISNIKAASYIKELIKCYCLSLINTGQSKKAAKILNKYIKYFGKSKELNKLFEATYEKTKNEKIKVVFLAQLSSLWTSFESVWKVFNKDERFETQIVQLPFYHHKCEQTNNQDVGDYLIQNNIPFKYWYEYDLFKKKPDIVFFQNHYDSTRPPEFSFENISKIVKRTVYIHYGLEVSGGELLKNNFGLPIHKNAWKVFVRSERYKQMFKEYCPHGTSHIIVTGHPKMDAIFNLQSVTINQDIKKAIKGRKVILWNPHHVVEEKGWSTFVEWWKPILSIFEKRKDMVLIIRPHPLLFGNLIRYSKGNELISIFKEKVNRMENVILDTTDNYLQAFKVSNAMISDASSLLLEYLPTKKPIMYLPKIDGGGLNDDGDIVNFFYKGIIEKDIWDYIDMVSQNKDPMFKKRVSQINNYLHKFDGKAGCRIRDHIISSMLSEEI